MQINEILRLKFPDADFLKDIILNDDGNGIYIKEWNMPNVPKPDQGTLDKWASEVQDLYDRKQKDLANEPILKQLKALDIKSIRALREGDQERIDAYEAEAQQLREQLQ